MKDMTNSDMRVSSFVERTRSQVGVFFCDTYALIELVGGNKNYKQYTSHILVTSDFNLMELYYSLLRDYGKEVAEHHFEEWAEFTVKIPRYIIKKS